jgi:hypothetical protein
MRKPQPAKSSKLAPTAPPPAPKPLAVGETALLVGAEDLRGYNADGLALAIGRLSCQLAEMTAFYNAKQARSREVMVAHGAAFDDAAKTYTLDTDKMTITRTK